MSKMRKEIRYAYIFLRSMPDQTKTRNELLTTKQMDSKKKSKLPKSIERLAKAIDDKGLKVKFGLEQQGHLELIESKFKKYPDFKYNQMIWTDIGEEIGWDSLTAALWYFQFHASPPPMGNVLTEGKAKIYAEKESVIHSMGYPEQSDSNRTLDAKNSFNDGFKSCYQLALSNDNSPNKWISVEERVPKKKDGEPITYELKHDYSNEPMEGYYDEDTWWIKPDEPAIGHRNVETFSTEVNITHWRPKPPL